MSTTTQLGQTVDHVFVVVVCGPGDGSSLVSCVRRKASAVFKDRCLSSRMVWPIRRSSTLAWLFNFTHS